MKSARQNLFTFSASVAFALCIVMIGSSASAKKSRHRRHRRHEPHVVAEKSLYERLGGKKTLEAVVDDFIKRCERDERVSASLATAVQSGGGHASKLRAQMVDELCSASGGPCHYSGPALKNARQSLDIDENKFIAAAESLGDALDARQVPEREKNELLFLVGSLRAEILGAAPSAVSGG